MNRDFTSGSIGIGAMIIFIALILVAAVSSTVMIQTIEKLQEDGDSTSNDVQDEISRKVELVDAYIRSVGGDCTVELFKDAGFSGAWSAVFEVGDYLVADFIAAGAVDNDASSIRIGAGCAASMFEGENFDGAWEAEVGEGNYDLADLEAVGLKNDQLSSMKIKGFGLTVFFKLSAGAPSILAGDISWSVGCEAQDGSFAIDHNTITLSGSRLIDGLNTFGQDFDILPNEYITPGMKVKVEVDFISCVPSLDENVEFTLFVNKGTSKTNSLIFGELVIGYDLIHQPW
ncbi:MAG: hypothetical protein NLN64_04285 [Candidatus Thalassarchaeaceae archaeon]|nr:hypothetical protein [Candidatus Thalassarchaeaceae archaeon]